MNALARHRLLLGLLVATVATGGWLVRRALYTWTSQQLAKQHQRAIAALPEHKAAALVNSLARDEDQWLAVLATALVDRRPEVASAAQHAINQRAEAWQQLPPDEAAPRAIELVGSLAPLAAQLPPDLQFWAGKLAQQLLLCPTGSRQQEAAQFIADCETIVRSMPAEVGETRLAQATYKPEPPARHGRQEPTPPVPQLSPGPASTVPQPAIPTPPAFVPAAPGGGDAVEPRLFAAPEAARVTTGTR